MCTAILTTSPPAVGGFNAGQISVGLEQLASSRYPQSPRLRRCCPKVASHRPGASPRIPELRHNHRNHGDSGDRWENEYDLRGCAIDARRDGPFSVARIRSWNRTGSGGDHTWAGDHLWLPSLNSLPAHGASPFGFEYLPGIPRLNARNEIPAGATEVS